MKTALSIACLLLAGCATHHRPVATVDIYCTEEGFFVIAERGKTESIAYRFNIAEVYEKQEPKTTTP